MGKPKTLDLVDLQLEVDGAIETSVVIQSNDEAVQRLIDQAGGIVKIRTNKDGISLEDTSDLFDEKGMRFLFGGCKDCESEDGETEWIGYFTLPSEAAEKTEAGEIAGTMKVTKA